MAKTKFYAVVQGRKPGIYTEWFGAHGAEVQIKGFAGAVYKSFTARSEAEAWFDKPATGTPGVQQEMPFAVASKKSVHKKTLQRPKHVQEPSRARITAAGARAVIYTDGGCSRNPGPGGYGVVLFLGKERRELSGGFAHTTNNRMELTACIKGLEALDDSSAAMVHSDSQYVVNGIVKGWAKRWKKNNWKRNTGDPAENSDLWARLLDLCEQHDVEFQWVRGHNGNQENERCDVLAVAMTQQKDLPPDHGYKKK